MKLQSLLDEDLVLHRLAARDRAGVLREMAAKLAEEPEHFLKTLAHEELGLSERTFPNPWKAAVSATLSTASGAFIPVSEDSGMIRAVREGAVSLAKLGEMTAVCSVGLDMVAVPGNTSAATLAGIIADQMAIGMVNSKTTAVRIIPVPGKGPGETVEWGGLLGTAIVQDPGRFSCAILHARGGRIPAPLQSYKN